MKSTVEFLERLLLQEPVLKPLNRFSIAGFVTALILSCSGLVHGQDKPLHKLVNPLIGTGGHGHTYPGASYPFGMVQLSPDTRLDGWDGCSGYHYSDNVIYGFSHTHLSGTGVADYCDLLIMPFTGENLWDNGSMSGHKNGYGSKFSHSFEKADAGYYSVKLDDHNIFAELTTSPRCGYHRYKYPEGENKKVIIDLEHRDKVLDSDLIFLNDSTIVGKRVSNSWATEQHFYFVIKFSEPVAERFFWKGFRDSDKVSKLIVTFGSDTDVLEIRVGVSAVDIKGAQNNLQTEIPTWSFESVLRENQDAWDQELGKITVSGKNPDRKRTFYTAAYHSYLAPNIFSDCDGRFRGMDQKIYPVRSNTQYTVFSLWDTFRALHPLFTITQRKRTEDFIESMLNHYSYGGRLPVWELAGNETNCMIGYHSVSVIADAYIKGIDVGDADLAMRAMIHSATLDNHGLNAYRNSGYISSEVEAESVSKTLEYAYDDWCIAVMADSLGLETTAEIFYKRSQFYKNLFSDRTKFMEPRFNGGWKASFRPEEVTFDYTEANAWQYSLFAPHDVHGLIQLLGGKQEFENWLDRLFTAPSVTTGREQADITGLIGQYAHGNEPSHHMAYLYNYTNSPDKTQKYVRQISTELYANLPDGLCGNEDCGQMSAWYVFSAMGFYPVTPGSDIYMLGTPLFDTCRIKLENGKNFEIIAKNLSDANFYVQYASLNGNALTGNFIRHRDIMNGGQLVFEMSATPSSHAPSPPRYSIPGENLIPSPYVTNSAQTYFRKKKVMIGNASQGEMRFTLDGSAPDSNSAVYTKPFVIKKTTTVKSISLVGGAKSTVSESTFRKSDNNWTIRLNTEYQNQYSGGGRTALIDNIMGGNDFRTGAWQAYLGRDLDVQIDMKKTVVVKSIYLSCLQDVGSWIWFPKEVQVMTSKNGKSWFTIGTAKNNVADDQYGSMLQKFGVEKEFKTRYIRIVAKTYGNCPPWHPGHGNPAHIFADEIIVNY